MEKKKEVIKELKDTKFQFLLSRKEKQTWEKAAIALEFDSLSEYIRHVCNWWSYGVLEAEK